MKTAIIVMSDPKAGADEALGRLFNALALAHASVEAGDEVELVFNGAGTRWPAELVKVSHPANGLYNSVRHLVMGASHGCAVAFGATAGVESSGTPLLSQQPIPGTPGLSDLRSYLVGDWKTLVF